MGCFRELSAGVVGEFDGRVVVASWIFWDVAEEKLSGELQFFGSDDGAVGEESNVVGGAKAFEKLSLNGKMEFEEGFFLDADAVFAVGNKEGPHGFHVAPKNGFGNNDLMRLGSDFHSGSIHWSLYRV